LTGPHEYPVAGTLTSIASIAAGILLATGASRFRRFAWRSPALAVAATLLVAAAANGRYIGQWAVRNSLSQDDDERTTRLGVFLGKATSADATVAVAYAGAIPYFADRPSIDLTGKNDPVIAREAERAPFRPGLNKWDDDYAIRAQRPDVIADADEALSDLPRLLPAWGYRRLPNGLFVRDDSRRVTWPCIAADWRAEPLACASPEPSTR
jgi:hypothetical protein